MKTAFNRSLAAGVLISMGCIVFLKLGGVAGAVMFSAGLWFVVNFDAELFTGRVTRSDYSVLQKMIMLLMNLIGAGIIGFVSSYALPELREPAVKMMDALEASGPLPILWKGCLCGVCMYLATTKVNDSSRLPFVVYGVALFILSGYSHSIALAGYAGAARKIAWWIIPIAAVGNALGSYGIKWLLTKLPEKKK